MQHVVDHRRQVRLIVDEPGAEAAAEEVAGAAVAAVEARGVAAEQEVHPAREPLHGRAHDEVEVRLHQAEGMARPSVAAHRDREQLEEGEPVVVVTEDGGVVDAARVDV